VQASARDKQQEFFREQRQNWRDQRREQSERAAQFRENARQFNEDTQNRALLLAASKRLRRIYFWGSTLLLFVVSPLVFFAPLWLGSHFASLAWVSSFAWLWLILGAIAVPLCALRGYFIWVRSHWYRWIGQGIKDDYEEGELLPSKRQQRQKIENLKQQYRQATAAVEAEAQDRSDEGRQQQ
jgi:hypothetical protein